MQRHDRAGFIGSVDVSLARQEKRTEERRERQERYKEFREREQSQEAAKIQSDGSGTDTESGKECDTVEVHDLPKKRRRIMSPSVCAVLDRTNVSVRKATMVVASVLNEADGPSTSSTVLSKSTVHRRRKKQREATAAEIKEHFSHSKCVVHWDGKLMQDNSGSSHERLPVLVTSLVDGSSKLLAVPQLHRGTGKASAEAVRDALHSWSCDTETVGMCFDTTAANTGRKSGAATLLEEALGRNLLWLSCRHHMLEVLLSDIFTVCFGPSKSADVPLFKQFHSKWTKLSHHNPGNKTLVQASESLKSFIKQQLREKHVREDYRELLQLAALAVGLDIQVYNIFLHL